MWVKSRRVDSVGFWEQNPAHPGGEVFVAGDAAVEVAETPAALSALANQLIERVDPPKPEAVETDKDGEPGGVGAMTVTQVKEALVAIEDADELQALRDQEAAGAARKGALAAIDGRLAELSNAVETDKDDDQ